MPRSSGMGLVSRKLIQRPYNRK